MSSNRLSALATLSIEREVALNLPCDIIDTFAALKERKGNESKVLVFLSTIYIGHERKYC